MKSVSHQSLGGLDKLIEEFKKPPREQKERPEAAQVGLAPAVTIPVRFGGYNRKAFALATRQAQAGRQGLGISANTRT